ncbi:MAG TPA: 3'-5' exonuclease, partial [Spirochaetota bacterium]|nr:3'-5' exonuclease [Spirochaetota bacterium]
LERETGSANGAHAEVVYMTMHGSKGLEFDTVIVAGVSDLVIPDRSTDIEEERRLMYVALSRARDRLFVIVHLNDDGSPARFGAELGLRI